MIEKLLSQYVEVLVQFFGPVGAAMLLALLLSYLIVRLGISVVMRHQGAAVTPRTSADEGLFLRLLEAIEANATANTRVAETNDHLSRAIGDGVRRIEEHEVREREALDAMSAKLGHEIKTGFASAMLPIMAELRDTRRIA